MSLLSLIGIQDALAVSTNTGATHQSAASGFLSMLPMLIIFVAVFYFLLIRPQAKRSKEHRKMMDEITIGDEIMTSGGIVGRVSKLRDNFVIISVAKNIEITIQKSAIHSVLPKGTLDSIGNP